jgi:hypothetical protein
LTDFKDLDPCPVFDGGAATLLSIGWLQEGVPFDKGLVSKEFFEVLVTLFVDPWQPAVAAGWHECPFCRFSRGPRSLCFGKQTVSLGISNVFVPGRDMIYVAPSLILHYIDAHEYRPPDEFVDAVLECPDMRSMAYLKALRARGYSLQR